MRMRKISGARLSLLIICAIYLLFINCKVSAQNAPVNNDTLRITIDEAEKLFLSKNFFILAQKFNIEEASAYQIQARLWNNPNLYYEQSIRNQFSGKYLPTRQGTVGEPQTQGEFIVQVQQLFLLAGKRNKQMNLAKINAEIAEFTFFDLMRSLKYQLRSAFFTTYFLDQTISVYEREIESLDKTVKQYQIQYERGNIPFKEVVRLKAFLFNLETERKDFRMKLIEAQQDLLLLIADSRSTFVEPIFDQQNMDSASVKNFTIPDLIEKAQANRYDLKAREAAARYEKMNLTYQRALAVPDLKLGGLFDRNGSYVPNYLALGVNVDIPLLNRNQGNIQAAKARVKGSELLLNSYSLQVEKEVERAYFKAVENDNLFKTFDVKFPAEFNKLIEGIISSYEKRNISLLEFIDFYESYKDSKIQFNNLQIDRMSAFEELNYSTGINLIKY